MNRLAVGLALWGIADAAWADTRRYALIAGANDGGSDRVALRYAVTDARSFGDVLEQLGGVPRSQQTLLVEPDRATLESAIHELARTVGVAEERGLRTEVVVYYSGHSDEQGLLLGDTSYPYDALKRDLETVTADVRVVVLDSCASGALVRTKGGVRVAGFLEDRSNDVRGTAYLMSATAEESAQESDVIGASFFTHYLVSGMRGGADHSQDGRVTLYEAFDFAKRETLRRTERTSIGPQHAMHSYNLGGHGDFVFTDLTRTPSSVIFDEPMSGRLFVRDEAGHLVAELDKPGDRLVELALRPGTYVIVYDNGSNRLESVMLVGDAEHVRVGAEDFTALAVEQVAARGPAPTEVGALTPAVPPRARSAPEAPPARAPHTPVGVKVAQAGVVPRAHTAAFQLGLVAVAEVLAGGQFALVSRADDGSGLQVGFIANTAAGFSGLQAAFVANVATGASEGWQTATFVNVAPDAYVGAQTALVNAAGDLKGAQFGLVNQARSARGLQVGLLNSGGDGNGLQVGLVNVARDWEGASLALVTVHKEGYNHVFGNVGTLEPVGVGATWGSRLVYTTAQLGGRLGPDGSPSLAIGGGVHLPRERFYLDTDLGVGWRFGGDPSRALDDGGLLRLRVQPGYALSDRIALQTGLVVEGAIGRIDLTPNATDRGLSAGWTFGVRL